MAKREPLITNEYAIDCIEDLMKSINPYQSDKEIKKLQIALSMGIAALRLVDGEMIYNTDSYK